MRLRALPAAALLGLALVAASAAWVAQATFAGSDGFSGQGGATCTACHVMPWTGEPATAVLAGWPATWEPGRAYALHIEVQGGPPAAPAPQPQGGFDLSCSQGALAPADGQEALMRVPRRGELTYRPAGTLMRAWDATWVAPTVRQLAAPPGPVTCWLAVLSANGNHVVATNVSDQGERLDAAASVVVHAEAAPAATAAWDALPLTGPDVRLVASHSPRDSRAASSGDALVADGRHTDGNATGIEWRLDGGPPRRRDTAQAWELALPTTSGGHVLEVRSIGAGRSSDATVLAWRGADPAPVPASEASRGSPGVGLAATLGGLALAGLAASALPSSRPQEPKP